MAIVISIENLWKEYRLGVIGHGTLTHDLQSWWAAARGKEDPNARIIPNSKGREKQIEGDHFWALQNINFEVNEGDIFGIIGKNGAGKSTFLKILSRVTAPTRGYVKIKGRISSLLEVGTGFHPELTGRENVYLNGAILGMSKQEVRKKFDEIVDFAGIPSFIDTPVKRYSSGMYVRLAFAVAAHLESEILVIDEVLAVGDAEFQRKCLGKMGEVAKDGRTVLFVSHNLGMIKKLCDKCILFKEGQISSHGDSAEIVRKYLNLEDQKSSRNVWRIDEAFGEDVKLLEVTICQEKYNNRQNLELEKPFSIEIKLIFLKFINECGVSVFISDSEGQIVLHTSSILNENLLINSKGEKIIQCDFPAYLLNSGRYFIALACDTPNTKIHFSTDNILSFTLESTSHLIRRYKASTWKGIIGPGMVSWSEKAI